MILDSIGRCTGKGKAAKFSSTRTLICGSFKAQPQDFKPLQGICQGTD